MVWPKSCRKDVLYEIDKLFIYVRVTDSMIFPNVTDDVDFLAGASISSSFISPWPK